MMRPDRFWSKVDIRGPDECWPWSAGFFPNGYGSFWNNGRSWGSHCVAWELTHKKKLGKSLCRHTCDYKPCCNPAHLRRGTSRQNKQDSVRQGKHARGESQGASKLTAIRVRILRKVYAKGNTTQTKLAKVFGINQTLVSAVVRGAAWRHV